MAASWIEILLLLLFVQDCTHSLQLIEVRIPKHVVKDSEAQLECLYDLDGEALYSVKWYKDGNEFYRYVPRDMPPAQIFILPGVTVDLHNSSDAVVSLRQVNLATTGRFRCEVSAEAPSFQTVSDHGDMVVVSLPDKGPTITGGRARYQIGDYVRVNCTSGRSKPATTLNWLVNGENAEPHMLRAFNSIVTGREGLVTTILGLQFQVQQHHFRNGDMKLKCIARLSSIYWRSNEESVEGDRPQKAPVLESRETVYASNSRADPVQGSSSSTMTFRELFVTKILSFFIQPTTNNAASDSVRKFTNGSNIFILIVGQVSIFFVISQNFFKFDMSPITTTTTTTLTTTTTTKQSISKRQNRICAADDVTSSTLSLLPSSLFSRINVKKEKGKSTLNFDFPQ